MTIRQAVKESFDKLGYDDEHLQSFVAHMNRNCPHIDFDSEAPEPFPEMVSKMFSMEVKGDNN